MKRVEVVRFFGTSKCVIGNMVLKSKVEIRARLSIAYAHHGIYVYIKKDPMFFPFKDIQRLES